MEIQQKYQKIDELFNVQDENVITPEIIDEYKSQKIQSVNENNNLDEPDDLDVEFEKNILKTQKVFNEVLNKSNTVLNTVQEKLLMYDEENTPDLINSYASLQKNLLDSLKTLTQSYKILKEAKTKVKNEKDVKKDVNIEKVNVFNLSTDTNSLIKELTDK